MILKIYLKPRPDPPDNLEDVEDAPDNLEVCDPLLSTLPSSSDALDGTAALCSTAAPCRGRSTEDDVGASSGVCGANLTLLPAA